jgi:hypothetical protein
VVVAKAAKQLVQAGDWRTLPGPRRPDQDPDGPPGPGAVHVGHLAVDAPVALGKQPPPGGCHWCAALIQRSPDKPKLDRTPTTLALLGTGCRQCRPRWRVDEPAAELVAAAHAGSRNLDLALPPVSVADHRHPVTRGRELTQPCACTAAAPCLLHAADQAALGPAAPDRCSARPLRLQGLAAS